MSKDIYKTASELAGLPGMPGTVQRVNEKARRESWMYRARTGKGGGKEYPLSALPEATRIFLSLQAGKDDAAQLYKVQLPTLSPELQKSTDAFHAAQPGKPEFSVDWDHFRRKTAKVQAKAYDQAAVVVQLKKVIDLDRQAVVFERAKKTPLDTLMKQVAAANPEVCGSWRTLQGWWLGRMGKPGCIHFDQKDYVPALSGSYMGRMVLAECSPAAFEYYVSQYMHRSQPSFKDSYRRTCELGKESLWSVPSEKALQKRFEDAYSIEAVTLLRQGEEAWRQLRPYMVRDKTVFRAGEAVSGDGLKFDRMWTKFPDGEIINTATAWFWMDLYSGKIVAWRLGKTESTDLFRLATYELLGHFLPVYMQIDNTRVAANKMMTAGMPGRHRFGNQPDDALGMLPMLGIDAHFTTPDHTIGSPGSKPIERAFGKGGIHEKVATNTTIRDRGFSKDTAISSDELREVIAYEVMRHNAQEKRRSPVCGGVLSFNQAYEQSFASWAPRKATEAQRRVLLLCFETAKCSSRNGGVSIKAGRSQLGANRYWSEGLNEYRGQSVAVFYDPDNLVNDVDIYSLDGRFLMAAQHEAGVGFLDKEAGGEYMKRTQRQKKLLKKQLAEDEAIRKLHDEKLPGLAPPETPSSKVVTGLFNKALTQEMDGISGQVIDAEDAFVNFMKMAEG